MGRQQFDLRYGQSNVASSEEGWSLHTGVGVRALLGSAYFDIHTEDDEVVAFGARSDGFRISNLQSLDSLLGGGPSADWLGLVSPSGSDRRACGVGAEMKSG